MENQYIFFFRFLRTILDCMAAITHFCDRGHCDERQLSHMSFDILVLPNSQICLYFHCSETSTRNTGDFKLNALYLT